MPVRSSRRTFLGALAAGFTVAPLALRADDRPRKPVSFLVISDTHLGYKDQDAAAAQWKKTAAELAKAPGDLIVHLGDVVDGGREPQYAVYKEIRDAIGKPVHEIPGNHDPLELFEKHIRKPVDAVLDHEWLRFLLLGNTRFGDHDGYLSQGQLAWIDEQCADAVKQDRFVILCMHVPAHENKHPDRGWYVKPSGGQKEFYEVVKRHEGRILALFHGHFHNGIRGWNDRAPVQELLFPSALYNQDRRLEEQKAPGYNVAEFRPGFTKVTIEDGLLKLKVQVVGAGESVGKDLRLPQVG